MTFKKNRMFELKARKESEARDSIISNIDLSEDFDDHNVEDHYLGAEGSALQTNSIPNVSDTDEISDVVTSMETSLQEEYLHGLVEIFLNSEAESLSSLPNLTEEEMNSIISCHVPSAENQNWTTEPQRKRRRFPGYRRVTRNLKDLLDYDMYLKKSADLYKVSQDLS